jgi:hypothetical protein
MPKTKSQKIEVTMAPASSKGKWLPSADMEEIEDNLSLVAPEVEFISTRYVVKLPYNDEHFNDHWKLRLYVANLVERRLGDDVQLTSLKIRRPSLSSRSLARLHGRVPEAKLYVTLKF